MSPSAMPSSEVARSPRRGRAARRRATTWPSRSGMRSSSAAAGSSVQRDRAARGALRRARRPRGEDRDAARRAGGGAGGSGSPAASASSDGPRRRLARRPPGQHARPPAGGAAGEAGEVLVDDQRGDALARGRPRVTCGAAKEGFSRTASAPSLATPSTRLDEGAPVAAQDPDAVAGADPGLLGEPAGDGVRAPVDLAVGQRALVVGQQRSGPGGGWRPRRWRSPARRPSARRPGPGARPCRGASARPAPRGRAARRSSPRGPAARGSAGPPGRGRSCPVASRASDARLARTSPRTWGAATSSDSVPSSAPGAP